MNRAEIKQSDFDASLIINDCTREDTGKYIMSITNSAGQKQSTITVRVLDTPGPASDVAVKDIKDNTVQLIWEMPAIDGGATVSNYIIERRLSGRKAWSTVITDCPKCSCNVTGLEIGKVYHFRVRGENEYGVGAPADVGPVRVSNAPGPVNKMEVADFSKTHANLVWSSLWSMEVPESPVTLLIGARRRTLTKEGEMG